MRAFVFTLTFLLAFASAAYAKLDIEAGCGQGRVADRVKEYCKDFSLSPNFAFNPKIQAMKAECQRYYTAALHLQNTFCSFNVDAAMLNVAASSRAVAEGVGRARDAEAAAALNYDELAKLAREYQAAFEKHGTVFHAEYENMIRVEGPMNAEGGNNVFMESTCALHMQTSRVPGHLQELLAIVTHGNAQLTYQSLWPATRHNVEMVKKLAALAAAKSMSAETRAAEVGKVFQAPMPTGESTGTDSRKPMTPIEGAVSGVVQEYVTRALRKLAGHQLPPGVISVIGGGLVIGYQVYTNKKILFPETAVSLLGMLQPELGMAGGVIVALGRSLQSLQKEYRDFAYTQLRQDKTLSLTGFQIARKFAETKKNDQCVKQADEEQACIEGRARLQAYEQGPCSRNAVLNPFDQAQPGRR